ncbi:MAG TPA: DNA repair protein RecO [Ignavibacteriaceae bacterium]|nr:DNA repair protein RecO [Ignavibacteriaceae bacterium]
MSEIVKTEAVVLNKIDFGDTSNIASFFTKEFGRISAIVKGGRNPKSKISLIVDPLNHLELVLYKKDSRDLQLISNASLIAHFGRIKEDFEKLKYSLAITELVKKLTAENEAHPKLFKGIIRILDLMETSGGNPQVLFGRFFIFFLGEIGYDLQLGSCGACGRANLYGMQLSYVPEIGILCENCSKNFRGSFTIPVELFDYLVCLKSNKMESATKETIEKALIFLEKYLRFHVPDFQGITSFKF